VIQSLVTSKDKDRYRFKNRRVAANVQAARHAVAIDECRAGFPVTLWDNLDENNTAAGRSAFQQRWFVGYHGDVGGGGREELSAWALKWVTEGAGIEGLKFYDTMGPDASPLAEAIAKASIEAAPDGPSFIRSFSIINWPIRQRQVWPKERLKRKERPGVPEARALFDDAVLARATRRELRYRPGPLRPFRKALQELAGSAPVNTQIGAPGVQPGDIPKGP